MDLASLLFILILVFIIAAFIIFRMFKKPAMEDLRLHYGEKLLLDDDQCSLEIQMESGIDTLQNVFVRVTSQRIIIAQRGKGRGSKHLLKYVIRYVDMPSLKKAVRSEKDTYATFQTELRKLSILENGLFRIEPMPGEESNVPAWLHIKTENINNYRELFQLKQSGTP